VSRTAYHKAARKKPDWSQYAGEPAGKTMRSRVARERAAFAQFVQSILEKSDNAEARTWLAGETRPHSHSLAKFVTAKKALKFVDMLYAAGAVSVIVAAISAGRRKQLYADWLLVRLPPVKSQRAALRKICREFLPAARRRGSG
jgi:hypothetical protein